MAVIIAFPSRCPPSSTGAVARLATPSTRAWQEQHLPLINATMNLVAIDDALCAARVRGMADGGDRALLVELLDELDATAEAIATVSEMLDRAARRIRAAMEASAT